MMRCERAVWEIIPFVRREIARIMVKRYKLKQKDVAKILGVKKSTISMYLRGKRGKKLEVSKKVISEIEKIAREVYKRGYVDQSDYCKICRMVR